MVQTRRERLREATSEEIKDVARRQMAEQGAAELSLRAIAAEMGLSAPALYRYYKSRDELVTALIVDAYNSLGDSAYAASAQAPNDEYGQRFLAVVLAYREWAFAHPHEFTLLFGTPIPGYHAPEEVTTPAATNSLKPFVEILQQAWHAGRIKLPPEYAAQPPELSQLLTTWAETQNPPLALPILAVTLAGWGVIQGLVTLEMYGHFDFLKGNIGELYHHEAVAYLNRLGLLK